MFLTREIVRHPRECPFPEVVSLTREIVRHPRECQQVFKGTASRFVRLEKFSLNFSSVSFVIRDNFLHPVYLKGHSQLGHMRIGYHSIANLHIKDTR